MMADGKRDVREKIMLGGIVVRAGLSKTDRAFLLGGLLELARVAPGSPEHQRLRNIGAEAFKAAAPDGALQHITETVE